MTTSFVKEAQEFEFYFFDGVDATSLLAWLNDGPGTPWYLYVHSATGNFAFVEEQDPIGSLPKRDSYAFCLNAGEAWWILPNPDWVNPFEQSGAVVPRNNARFFLSPDDNGVPAGYDPA